MLGTDSTAMISLAQVIMCTNYPSSKVRGSFITYMNEPFLHPQHQSEKWARGNDGGAGEEKGRGKCNGFWLPWKEQRRQAVCAHASWAKSRLLEFTGGPKWCATFTMFFLSSKLVSPWPTDIKSRMLKSLMQLSARGFMSTTLLGVSWTALFLTSPCGLAGIWGWRPQVSMSPC